jgi:predicted dehydrogenase
MTQKDNLMQDKERANEANQTTRRQFLKTTAAAGTALATNLGMLANVHAAGSDTIKVGLIGCGSYRGGRGRGAVENCVSSAANVKLVAMADLFRDHLEYSLSILEKQGKDRVDVPEDKRFSGFDAYEKLLKTDVDMVILATPPGFRPLHLEAAVAAGKNIFTEKPVAVDAAGVRRVLAAYEESKKKNLRIAAGTQRRHQTGYLETMKRLHDGAIGQITGGRCYWNQGSLWVEPRKTVWSDVEWQIRNWLYFTWLSGDHICEQHVHNLDVMNWALGAHPVRAVGMGGRQVRTDPKYGNIFDHFAVDYEYPDGVHVMSMCRQIPGCENNVSEALTGTKGFCRVDAYTIRPLSQGEEAWRFPKDQDNAPYVQEHTDLIASIRSGKPINELKNVAESTLTAIMGRMSTYTGKAVTWEKALNSKEETMPANLEFGSMAVAPVAVPGKTPLI